MALSTRLIKSRIRSIKNTRKITKAMELVAASKMRKSVQLTVASRAYAGTLGEVVDDVRTMVRESSHVFLSAASAPTTSLVIVASSDRGLCGAFNAQVLKKTFEFLRERRERTLKIVTVGKRAEQGVRRAGYSLVAAFEAISNAPSFERIRPLAELAAAEFREGRVDRVFVVTTDYRSALSQVPRVFQLLPMIPEQELAKRDGAARAEIEEEEAYDHVMFEPSPSGVLDELLPRVLETRLYQALLESSSSEHASRMMAMRSATDSASTMLEDLTLTFNQARQASITREISEISAGKAALET